MAALRSWVLCFRISVCLLPVQLAAAAVAHTIKMWNRRLPRIKWKRAIQHIWADWTRLQGRQKTKPHRSQPGEPEACGDQRNSILERPRSIEWTYRPEAATRCMINDVTCKRMETKTATNKYQWKPFIPERPKNVKRRTPKQGIAAYCTSKPELGHNTVG